MELDWKVSKVNRKINVYMNKLIYKNWNRFLCFVIFFKIDFGLGEVYFNCGVIFFWVIV